MSDFDPVEIDINLKHNVDTEGEKAVEGIDNIVNSSDKARAELEKMISVKKEFIAGLREGITEASKEFANMNIAPDDKRAIDFKNIISQMVDELNKEEAALSAVATKTESYTEKQKSFRAQIMDTKESMRLLRLQGQENSEQYQELQTRLGLLGNVYHDITEEQKALASDTPQLQGAVEGLSALSGVLTAGAGAYGLVNTESEAFEKIQTKVQSLMAVTVGLQEIANTLEATSAFRIQTVTKAKQLWTAATTRLTVALGISNTAAKVLMGTLTLGLGVAIGFIINAIDNFVSKQREAKKAQEEFNQAVAESSAGPIASYQKMRTEWNSLGDDLKAKEKYINDQKKAFEGLGTSINSVNEAEKYFSTEGMKAFVSAVVAKSSATASFESAVEKYKEYQKAQNDASTLEEEIKALEKTKNSGNLKDVFSERRLVNKRNKLSDLQAESKALNNEFNTLIKKSVDQGKAASKALEDAGINSSTTLVEGTKAWWEEKQKAAKAAIDAMKDTEAGSAKWNQQVNLYNKATEKLKAFDLKQEKGTGQNKQDALDKLKKMSYDIQSEIDAATVAAMQEGAVQQEAELKAKYDKQIALIEKKKLEIASLEKVTGGTATEQRGMVQQWENAEAEKYKTSLAAIKKVTADELDKMWADINSRTATALDNQLADIDSFYNERKDSLKNFYTDEQKIAEEAARLDKQRERERLIATTQNELEKLSFETSIQLRRQQLKDRNLLLETRKEENLIKIEKQAAEDRLKKLKKMEAAGADVASEIESVTLEIEEMNAALDDMPVNKLLEAIGVLQSVVGADSKFGQALSGISGNLQNFTKGMQQLKSADTIGGSIMGGLSVAGSLYSMGKSIDDAQQKKAQEEQQRYYEAQERYITNMIKLIELQTKALKDLKGEEKISGSKSVLTQLEADNANLEKNAKNNIRIFEKFVAKSKWKWYGYVTEQKEQFKDLSGYSMDELTNMRDLWLTSRDDFFKKYGAIFRSDEEFKVLDDYVNQYAATQEQIQEIQNKINEDLTGTTYDSILSGIVDAFADGTMSAEEFSDNFNTIMKKSIMNAFSRQYLEKQLAGWYDDFAAASDTSDGEGLTEAKIETLRKSLQKITADAQKGLETMTSVSGLDFSAAEEGRQASSKGIAQASQESIDELNGRMTAIQGFVFNIRDYSQQSIDLKREQAARTILIQNQLDTIAENTEYCRHLEGIKNALDDMNLKGVKIKS